MAIGKLIINYKTQKREPRPFHRLKTRTHVFKILNITSTICGENWNLCGFKSVYKPKEI